MTEVVTCVNDATAHNLFQAALKVTRKDTYCGYRSEVDNGWKHAFIITNRDGSDATVFQWTCAGGAGGLDIRKHPTITAALAQLRALLEW